MSEVEVVAFPPVDSEKNVATTSEMKVNKLLCSTVKPAEVDTAVIAEQAQELDCENVQLQKSDVQSAVEANEVSARVLIQRVQESLRDAAAEAARRNKVSRMRLRLRPLHSIL